MIHPWPVAGIALWLGLVQDILIPIGLGIVDSRFCKWVSGVYRCSGKKIEEKLPHVGLDGKFRPFGSTGQPRSLEITNPQGNGRQFQPVEHRFPITNGSLYTSIDGRLPVIHNYRRNKDQRSGLKTQEKQSSNVALHSSHLSRVEFSDTVQKFPSCGNCEADLCPSHSNLHHLSPHYVNKHLNLHQGPGLLPSRNGAPSRVSQSQESLTYLPTGQDKQCFYRNSDMNLNGGTNHVMKNSRNLVRLNKMRLSRSEDSLNELQREFGNVTRIHVQKSRNPAEDRPKNYRTTVNINVQNGYSSSDDDCLTDTNDPSNANPNDTFDSMSSKSCYSITTEANCDFEFFQSRERLPANLPQVESAGAPNNNEQYYPLSNSSYQSSEIVPKSSLPNDMDKNFRITRSNSKRSLESFRAFIESEDADLRNNNLSNTTTLQRSNSYGTLDDRKNKHSLRHKIKSIEYLPGSNTSTVYIEDLSQYGCTSTIGARS
ncbi:hypothetical protein NQ317_004616 [Molorchus minor]|uniref:Uncharacterized protein n=1 Tax=Molorchus minor TaxID=1323400 RepID=A0ABQ9J4V9_9CUCU|nr:hypothetical protein NQ317_004616 [Molorchus minor]